MRVTVRAGGDAPVAVLDDRARRRTQAHRRGERLGISRTTTREHLKRADKEVMGGVYEFLDVRL